MYHSMNDSIVSKVENDRIGIHYNYLLLVYFNTNWGVIPSDYERKY